MVDTGLPLRGLTEVCVCIAGLLPVCLPSLFLVPQVGILFETLSLSVIGSLTENTKGDIVDLDSAASAI